MGDLEALDELELEGIGVLELLLDVSVHVVDVCLSEHERATRRGMDLPGTRRDTWPQATMRSISGPRAARGAWTSTRLCVFV
jgi:hypothetical protein